jgi:hypothetical protein
VRAVNAAGAMRSLMGVSDAALLPYVLAHYWLTAPLSDASLSGTPIVYRNHPNGIDKTGIIHATAAHLKHVQMRLGRVMASRGRRSRAQMEALTFRSWQV